MITREAYTEKVKLQLDELNVKITELEARAQLAKQEARARFSEEMGKLRHQSALAQLKFDELKSTTETSWDNMVAEMEKARDAFTHSYHYFTSQFKADASK